MCLYNKVKQGKPFKPQVYQRRGGGQRQSYDRDRSRNNSRQGQSFGQNRHGNDYRRNEYTQKFLVEIIAGIEAETSTVTIVVTGVDQQKEDYFPEGIIIIIIIIDKT